MDQKEVREYLDAFIVLIELSGDKIKYEYDGNSIRLKHFTNDFNDYGSDRDIISLFFVRGKFVIYMDKNFANREYDNLFEAIKRFAKKHTKELDLSICGTSDGKNMQIVIEDPDLTGSLIEMVVANLMTDNDLDSVI